MDMTYGGSGDFSMDILDSGPSEIDCRFGQGLDAHVTC